MSNEIGHNKAKRDPSPVVAAVTGKITDHIRDGYLIAITEAAGERGRIDREAGNTISFSSKALLSGIDGWRERDVDLSGAPAEIRLAIDTIEEAAWRTHGVELRTLSARWLAAGGDETATPVDLARFGAAAWMAQTRIGLDGPAQIAIFLALEKEVVKSLSFLLFEVNAMLGEARPVKADGIVVGTDFGHPKSDVDDEVLFNSLCDLLKVWEPGQLVDGGSDVVGPNGETKTGRPMTTDEIFSVLAVVQRWVPKALEEALGRPEGLLAEQIKETLIKQAESLGIPRGEVHVSEDNVKAVNLVDRVFTRNLYDRKMADAGRVVVAQMLFPSVKAAILNRQWFSQDNHPARRLIDQVTDACAPEDGEASEEMINKASQTVDRLVSGFNEDVSVFEVLAMELQDFLAGEKIRTEPASSDLDRCMERVNIELRQRWQRYVGPDGVRSFALEIAIPYFADLDVNGQRGSMVWVAGMGVMDNLMALKSTSGRPVKIDGQLRGQLIRMLAFSGWTGVRAHHRLAEQEDFIHSHFSGERATREGGVVISTEAAEPKAVEPKMAIAGVSQFHDRMDDTEILGRNINKDDEIKAGPVGGISKNGQILAKILAMEVGSISTWVEPDGEKVAAKLSWVSPQSKFLFTNRNGRRVLIGTPDELVDYAILGRFFPNVWAG